MQPRLAPARLRQGTAAMAMAIGMRISPWGCRPLSLPRGCAASPASLAGDGAGGAALGPSPHGQPRIGRLPSISLIPGA